MNVLVLGSGGREHALSWKISHSPLVEKVYIAPGNAGTAEVGENVALDLADHKAIAKFCTSKEIGLVVVGPDDLLAAGIVDFLQSKKIAVFGPRKAAAEIEWSKAYAKQVMQEDGIPTARHRVFETKEAALEYAKKQTLPLVIKADGLALGKGVIIAKTEEEVVQAIDDLMGKKVHGDAGNRVVIEEYLEGLEISVHAICDGDRALMFPSSKDHKRIFEGDAGPNTGGMGTVAPVPLVPERQMRLIQERIVDPLLAGLKKRGRPFSGLLFPGIMLTKYGPMVIEFNARFGDPETQSYMRLMKGDIVPALLASARGSLEDVSLEWHEGAAACVVMASGGYPGAYEKGKEITGIKEAETTNTHVFHAGTKRTDDLLVTNGGRVLNVTAHGATLQDALVLAYAGVDKISFEGAQYRKDIGLSLIGAGSVSDFADTLPDRVFPFPEKVQETHVFGEEAYDQALARNFAKQGDYKYGIALLSYRELFHVIASGMYIAASAYVAASFANVLYLYGLLGALFLAVSFKEFYYDPKHRGQTRIHGLIDWLAWVLPMAGYVLATRALG